MSVKRIYLGLPAYNERESINPLFEKIDLLRRSTLPNLEVLFYDDGCIDGTKEILQKWIKSDLSISYIDGVVNKGLGTALNSIISHFIAHADTHDVLVIMDCDDTHDPAQIPEMLAQFVNPEVNIITASRYRKGARITGVPWYRILLSLGAAMLYKLVHPLKNARDYTCGYRMYKYDILFKAIQNYSEPFIKERGFSCMVELLLRLKHCGANIREIPLRLSYDNKRSASKMDVSGNTLRLLKKLISWRIRGLV